MSGESKGFVFSLVMFVAVAVVIALVMNLMTPVLKGHGDEDMSGAAVAQRIKPVGEANTGAPMTADAPAPVAARSGEAVYNSVCVACHGTGAAGAPRVGDKAAWAPRIATGMDALLKTAINGRGAMPPRGTCGNCSDEELKKAVEYMVSKSQ